MHHARKSRKEKVFKLTFARATGLLRASGKADILFAPEPDIRRFRRLATAYGNCCVLEDGTTSREIVGCMPFRTSGTGGSAALGASTDFLLSL